MVPQGFVLTQNSRHRWSFCEARSYLFYQFFRWNFWLICPRKDWQKIKRLLEKSQARILLYFCSPKWNVSALGCSSAQKFKNLFYFKFKNESITKNRSDKPLKHAEVAQKKMGGASNCLSVWRLMFCKNEDKREFCERQFFWTTQGIGKADVRPGCPFLRPFFCSFEILGKKGTKENIKNVSKNKN